MDIVKTTKKYFLSPNGGNQKNSSYKSDIEFNLNGIITNEKYILYNTISINHAEIPNSFYIINVYNNLLSLSTGDIYIDRGNYNVSSLQKFINSKLPTTMMLSFNSTNGKFTLTSNEQFYINESTTINKILGLDKTVYTSIYDPNLYHRHMINFPYPANCLGTKNLYIKSNFILDNFNTITKDYLTLACIPVSVEPYGIILFNNFTNAYHIVKNIQLDNIEIKIYDDDDNLVNFNNIDWSITLELNTFMKQDFNNINLNNYLNKLNNST